ncbi:substrate-binding periplasmic protein [Chitinilyticum aquatile]|uniref:substrate-binding periplasmic protein n=1 Tax=Chitinilyticum aquatile TaxID=362520 RepID=UPI0004153D5B|nr:transporter substrate-binding domain-containing protein [Chitinilyticum aquatile]
METAITTARPAPRHAPALQRPRFARIRRWLVACALLLPFPLAASNLQAFTEEFPPFNYMLRGQHRGLANEILDAVIARSGLQIERQSYPWTRSVYMTGETPDSLLYTIVRTPEREKLYRWVGPFDDCDVQLIRLRHRKDVHVASLDDARHYRIGAARNSAGTQILQAKGFPVQQIDTSASEEKSVRMLYAERFELSVGLLIAHRFEAKRQGLDPDAMEVLYTLQKGSGCYFAFNTRVNEQFFTRFEKAFEELKHSGELQRIRERYQGK